jgi:broad specificity phosphatase PhoE
MSWRRRNILLLLIVLAVCLEVLPWDSSLCEDLPTTVIIVRHAEKSAPTGDIPLSEAGFERAQTLARVVSDAGISAIYTSKLLRTIQTAEPSARLLGLVPQHINEVKSLAKNILDDHAGQTVLVVHHSDTLPELIVALGANTKPIIGENEFDKLFVVTVYAPHKVKVLILRYGK